MQTNTELSVVVLRRKKNIFTEIWQYKQLMLMVLPAFIYFVIFRYGSIFGVVIAFKDFRPMAGRSFWESIIQSSWVGLENFKVFFTSMNGIQILKNTIIISMLKILIGFPAAIVLALLFNEITSTKMKKIFQTITYLPYFFSWVVLAGIVRIVFSPDNGVIVFCCKKP